MPTYDYKCNKCKEIFEAVHSMKDKLEKCILCGDKDIKKVFSPVFFVVTGGTPKFGTYGYTGRHQNLVSKLKDNPTYREGYRKEVSQKEKEGFSTWQAEKKAAESQRIFEKMKEEGSKMTKKEKEDIKREFGIKKGMKVGKI